MRRPVGPRAWRAIVLTTLLLAGGCTSPAPRSTSKEFFRLTEDSAANKSMQTRRFEISDGDELLSASAAALQDLGFQVTEADRTLGFLRAAKERSARETGQEWNRAVTAFVTFAVSVFAGANTTLIMPIDLHQQINASLIAHPLERSEDGARFEVRVMFYRLVWKGEGQSGDTYIPPGEQMMEMIRDAEMYQRFFARLNKSVFLEGEKI